MSRCCIEGVLPHHLSRGALGKKQVDANLVQISRLLRVELTGTGLSLGRRLFLLRIS